MYSISLFLHCYKELSETGKFMKKRNLMDSQFQRSNRKHDWKLMIMADGKGEASILARHGDGTCNHSYLGG